MPTVTIHAFDALGRPLAGLGASLAWTGAGQVVNAVSGALEPGPGFVELGNGVYKTVMPRKRAGFVDLTADAIPRYWPVLYEGSDAVVLYAMSVNSVPLPGLAPTWSSLVDVDTGLPYVPQPAIAALGIDGLYKFTPVVDTFLSGVIDLGLTAQIRYPNYFSHDSVGPEVTNVNPPVGTTISRSASVGFDVIDTRSEVMAVELMAYYPDGTWEAVYDGVDFVGAYTGSVAAVTDGWRFTVQRTGGWLSSPTIRARAQDSSGNKE